MITPSGWQHHSKRIEALLWTTGLACVLMCGMVGARAVAAREAAAAFRPTRGLGTAPAFRQVSKDDERDAQDVIGRMDIPKLGLTVPILSDYDPESLRKGVGHIHGTAFPGGLGTVGLAGHRDTFLRPLRRIAPGMQIRLIDRNGAFAYQVDRTEVVLPEQVEVLDIRERPELTVVTCFPFDYVGAAPKRFIVHAHLLSLLPE